MRLASCGNPLFQWVVSDMIEHMFDRVIDRELNSEIVSDASSSIGRPVARSVTPADEFGEFSDEYLRLLTDVAAVEYVADDGLDRTYGQRFHIAILGLTSTGAVDW